MEKLKGNLGKFVYVKYFTNRCIYENSDDKEHEKEYMDLYTTLEDKSLISCHNLFFITNFSCADTPLHWKYLERCIPLNKFPNKKTYSTIVMVEKYKTVAIAYDFTYVKQPVVIFRYCCEHYEKLQIGKTYQAEIGKFFVPEDKENTTLVLTDLFCMVISPITAFYDMSPTSISVIVSEYLIDLEYEKQSLKKYKSGFVMFTDFGAVYVPRELTHIFDHKNPVIMAKIIYVIRGIEKDFYTCWELTDDFTLYVNNKLYASSKHGYFRLASKKEQRRCFEIYNGDEVLQFCAPVYVKDNVQHKDSSSTFGGRITFVHFCPERKRPEFR